MAERLHCSGSAQQHTGDAPIADLACMTE